MIQFDPHTLASWKERHISHISIIVTDTGCAGHKIRIEEGVHIDTDSTLEQDGLTLSMKREYLASLDGSRITHTGKKWILTSSEVNTRCGCGSSFSLKS